ncbi:unnamed protein product, partial [Didymodactylos carnosus]
EEVCVTYLFDHCLPTNERQKLLQSRNFKCQCLRCSKSPPPTDLVMTSDINSKLSNEDTGYVRKRYDKLMEKFKTKVFGCGSIPLTKQWINGLYIKGALIEETIAPAHKDGLSQQWRADNLSPSIPTDRWAPNSPDLNPLDYSIWNELVQAMNYEHVTTKATLIEELKRAVKKVCGGLCAMAIQVRVMQKCF